MNKVKIRSSQAQSIHTQLFMVIRSKYIADANWELKVFNEKISAASNNQLMETSANGFTILHDILHLTDILCQANQEEKTHLSKVCLIYCGIK